MRPPRDIGHAGWAVFDTNADWAELALPDFTLDDVAAVMPELRVLGTIAREPSPAAVDDEDDEIVEQEKARRYVTCRFADPAVADELLDMLGLRADAAHRGHEKSSAGGTGVPAPGDDAKVCRTCGAVKPLGEFYKDRSAPDGHTTQCKGCRRAARGRGGRELKPCGTEAAWARHKKRGEKPCEACETEHRRYHREDRRRRRAKIGSQDTHVGMPRKHGTRERYVRGPDEHDQPGKGCRCGDCRAANAARNRHVYRMQAYGQWQPFVDAAPARAHVEALVRQGLKPSRVAKLAGVAQPTVDRLLYGFPSRGVPPSPKIRTGTAEALLAVQMRLDDLPARARIDPAGTRRRIQALVAVGWSLARLAERAGISRTNFTLLLRADGVSAGTARTVRALYDDLWDQAPPTTTREDRISVTRSLSWAAERGWPRPQEWDDDEIDDPAATPHIVGEGSRMAAHVENADELERQGYTIQQIAERLGVTKDAIVAARRRTRESEAIDDSPRRPRGVAKETAA